MFCRGRHGPVHKCKPHEHSTIIFPTRSNSSFMAFSLPFPSDAKIPSYRSLEGNRSRLLRLYLTNEACYNDFFQTEMVSAFWRLAFFLPLVSGVAHRSGPKQVDVRSFHTQPETFELISQLLLSLIRAHGPLKNKTQASYIPRWSCSIFDQPLLLAKFSVLYRRNVFSLLNYLTDFTRK